VGEARHVAAQTGCCREPPTRPGAAVRRGAPAAERDGSKLRVMLAGGNSFPPPRWLGGKARRAGAPQFRWGTAPGRFAKWSVATGLIGPAENMIDHAFSIHRTCSGWPSSGRFRRGIDRVKGDSRRPIAFQKS